MSAHERDLELLNLLCSHEILRLRGYTFTLAPRGGVITDRWGHVRGIWHYERDRYSWTPASHTEPVHWSENAQAAVRYTLVTLTAV
jgi:hypothetical protein